MLVIGHLLVVKVDHGAGLGDVKAAAITSCTANQTRPCCGVAQEVDTVEEPTMRAAPFRWDFGENQRGVA
jgi:hypothetical protein